MSNLKYYFASKNIYTFARTKRFETVKPICDAIYESDPLKKYPRAAGIGYGQRASLHNTSLQTPAPNSYSINRLFEKNHKQKNTEKISIKFIKSKKNLETLEPINRSRFAVSINLKISRKQNESRQCQKNQHKCFETVDEYLANSQSNKASKVSILLAPLTKNQIQNRKKYQLAQRQQKILSSRKLNHKPKDKLKPDQSLNTEELELHSSQRDKKQNKRQFSLILSCRK